MREPAPFPSTRGDSFALGLLLGGVIVSLAALVRRWTRDGAEAWLEATAGKCLLSLLATLAAAGLMVLWRWRCGR